MLHRPLSEQGVEVHGQYGAAPLLIPGRLLADPQVQVGELFWAIVQHRESQGNESDLFMSYFPHGLKYQEGGVESAFHKTSPGTTLAAIKKLYQVKGKKNIRATERMLSWDSFNTGDCFILDLGQVSGQG